MNEQELSRTTIHNLLNQNNYSVIDHNDCCSIISIPPLSINNIIIANDEIIAPIFKSPQEITCEYESIVDFFKEFNLNEFEWFKSLEATLVRLYYFNNKWCLSTQKKLDAFKSKWSCQYSFGELFNYCLYMIYKVNYDNIMDWFTSQLDQSKCYIFLIRSNVQNRIVCHPVKPENQLVYIGYFSSPNKEYPVSFNHCLHSESESILQSILVPEKLSFESLDDILSYINNMNPFQYQGIIGLHKETHKPIKILHPDYQQYFSIRGNNPNIKFRYLEIRTIPEKLRLFYFLYPKYIEQFDEFENILFEISRIIYRSYINRYVKKKYVTLPKEEYNIMKKCHDWFHQDRKNNKIYTQKIMEFINQENPENLYKMINRFISHSKNQNDIFSSFFKSID